MTTRFWWIRHGPTHAKGFVGWKDLPADLSDTAALERLESHLPPSAVIVSSDLQRAATTASAVAGKRRRLADFAGLRELDFGDWDGMPIDEAAKIAPEISRAFWSSPGSVRAPNGESWDDMAARVSQTVDTLIAGHEGADIVCVAHFAVILSAIQRATNMSVLSAFSFKIDNFSLTRIDYIHKSQAWRVNGVNLPA